MRTSYKPQNAEFEKFLKKATKDGIDQDKSGIEIAMEVTGLSRSGISHIRTGRTLISRPAAWAIKEYYPRISLVKLLFADKYPAK